MWVNHFKKTGTLIKLRKFPQKIIIMNSIYYASLNILKEYSLKAPDFDFNDTCT